MQNYYNLFVYYFCLAKIRLIPFILEDIEMF